MCNINCPKCNKETLILKIEHTYIFSLKDISTNDVIPKEKLDSEGRKFLECFSCGWQGWAEHYWEVKEGLVPLFNNPMEAIYEDID